MEDKECYYVYRIINLLDRKQYVGDHSTNDLNDNYLGSGILLKRDQKKYGKENFQKEILEFFNNKKESYNAQKKYIKLYETHVSQGGYNKNWTGGQWPSAHSKKTKKLISKGCMGKTSPKKYNLIDPDGNLFMNVCLNEICRKYNLNFHTIRKRTNRGKIQIRKTKNIKENTLNCEGWEVIRKDLDKYKYKIKWILIDPAGNKIEIFKNNFANIIKQYKLDWRILNRNKNKGTIKIKNRSQCRKETLNTEGWEIIYI